MLEPRDRFPWWSGFKMSSPPVWCAIKEADIQRMFFFQSDHGAEPNNWDRPIKDGDLSVEGCFSSGSLLASEAARFASDSAP